MKGFYHAPVMLAEVIEGLSIRENGIYVDGTVGGGGHSEAILSHLTTGKLIGFDRDENAVEAARERLVSYGERATIVRENYKDMNWIIQKLGYKEVNGILLDLGVSSYQLDEKSRGFSYMGGEERLDMRMDRRQTLDACTILNTYSRDELVRVFREYGEERFAGRIARQIVQKRKTRAIETANDLNALIEEAVPAKYKVGRGHPAKRVYQALRIEVNDELKPLSDAIDGMIDLLAVGGRLCVITFHSLEDRIVKRALKRNEDPCTCPKDLPVCVCGKKSKGRVVGRKPIVASDEELRQNGRSKSAKLRIFEKC
ncbi:MAG: 16S rRNA (cytosine(1402)-N(4))-methyltransferase RsmH [Lachnospiraceae bacterium]|nr:16S rRNA (cytosine(1402)-N(4))-methyltransferase RsmH [Lachnospiraceae bacterium]